jgi:hypothetical protein
MPDAAAYLQRHIEDLVGVRSGSIAAAQGEWAQRVQLQLLRAARRAGPDTTKGQFYSTAAKLPNLIPFLAAQIYPYALGARVDKVWQNILQPFTLTYPAIALRNPANFDYVLRGFADTAKQLATNMGGLQRFLVSKGLAPADQPFEAHKWMREGLDRSAARRLGRNAIEGLNRAAMFFYSKSDEATRMIAYHVARRIAEDAKRGVPRALDVLQEAGPGWRSEILEKLSRGRDVTDDVAAWLNGYTSFNYNRVSMSEYGRFFGSLMSTFTKWPLSLLGDIAYRVDKGTAAGARLSPEMMRLGMKYLGPWLGLAGVHHLVADDIEQSPVAQNVVGRDLASAAPLGSLSSLLKGGPIASAPVPRLVGETLHAGVNRGPEAAGVTLLRQMPQFVPGGVVLRFMYRDLPMWSGEEPEKGGPGRLLLDDLGIERDEQD